MNFSEFYKLLSDMFPESLRCSWDNDGVMCCDNPNREVKKVLISLDVTMDVIDFAKENGFDTVVSHHPLVFFKQESLNCKNYVQRKLIELCKNEISVISLHTRLDAGVRGVTETLCNVLGFETAEKDDAEPVGRIIELKKETNIKDFCFSVKKKLNSPVVFFSGSKDVKRVYVCGGDGKDQIDRAIQKNADTILTGRLSYNTMIDAKDRNLNMIEAGHFYTENPVCEQLQNIIKATDCSIETHIYNSNQIECI